MFAPVETELSGLSDVVQEATKNRQRGEYQNCRSLSCALSVSQNNSRLHAGQGRVVTHRPGTSKGRVRVVTRAYVLEAWIIYRTLLPIC